MSINQSVDRALRILWALNGGLQRATVTEITEGLDVHKSTASRLLATLERQSLATRRKTDLSYELGQGILQLTGSVNTQSELTKSAQVLVESVAEDFKPIANAKPGRSQIMNGTLI
ncbi:MAG TPA: helix-turn-helix domain-containing protein [Candidatus Yaniella excrementigallinarum]|nr:helix-turn-helix domain-containing protein [Candidatus Yaniella excrementigallinarum]